MHPIIRLIAELELYLQVATVTPHEKWEINALILQLNLKLDNGEPELRTTAARNSSEGISAG